MARRHNEETAFGSDSFLDIVANVVGILIILIVVAGLRVSRAPVLADAPPAPPPTVSIAAPPLEEEQSDEPPEWTEDPFEPQPTPPPVLISPPHPQAPKTIIVERPLPALPELRPDAQLVERSEQLRAAIARTQSVRAALEQQLAQMGGDAAAASERLSALKANAESVESRHAAERGDLAASERDLSATLEQLDQLRKNVEAESNAEPQATVLQHHVTPIGRVVRGQELHFLLSKGRVSPVPVDELARRLTSQIERQKEMLAKMQTYDGEIGPVDGFRMRYTIQRSRMTLAEELKYGAHVVRMGVSQWTLVPDPNVPSESAADALQRGSKFYEALLSAGANATLTFWVYPDSFDTCQALEEFAHRYGYEVAARPLPFGIPITGSPDGSKSVAQ